MPTLTRHYPFVAGLGRQETASVESVEDLYLVPWLQHVRHGADFDRFVVSGGASELLLLAELEHGGRYQIVGLLDAPVPGVSRWRPPHSWTHIVPGDRPTKVLQIERSGSELRQRAEQFDWAPMERLALPNATALLWNTGDTETGAFVDVVAKEGEVCFRTSGDEETCGEGLARTTEFLIHLLNFGWPPFTWKAYSIDEDSGEMSEVVTGHGAMLARELGLSTSRPSLLKYLEKRRPRPRPTLSLEGLPDIDRWRDHPLGFYRFSGSTVGDERWLIVELAYGYKAYRVQRLDTPLSGLTEYQQRRPRRYWTHVVPGRFPTLRLVVHSAAIDFQRRAEAFQLTNFVRVGADVYWDNATAARVMKGETQFPEYMRLTVAPHEITFDFYQPQYEDWDFIGDLDETTRFLAYVMELLDRSFGWRAYSIDEKSGQTSDIVRGDGIDLAARIELPPLVE